MRQRFRQAVDGSDVNMTPMLDVVFILLVFFIVSSVFLQEKGVEMLAPPSSDPVPIDDPSILVQIDAGGVVFVNGRATDVARVTAAVQRLKIDAVGQGGVVILPDPDSEHGVVTRVFDAAQAAHAGNVVVRAPERWES